MSLDLRKEIKVRDINFGDISKKVIFKTTGLDELA